MKIDISDLNRQEAHHLLINTIIPRPIVWVSTTNQDGIYNLAPFSTLSILSAKPAVVGFSVTARRDGQVKDTPRNINATKEFVIATVNEDLLEAMNITAEPYPSDVSEFEKAGLTAIKADMVQPALVAESHVNMECRFLQVMEFGEAPTINMFFIGEVLRMHVQDEIYVNGEVQVSNLHAVARLGGDLYSRTQDIFTMKRPDFDP